MEVYDVDFVHYKIPGFSVTIKLFSMLPNVQRMQCDTVKVAMVTWHFGSVNSVADRKTFALHYCETPFYPHSLAALLLSWEVGDREKAMAWNLHESGSIEKGMLS